jgi:hypothetical protein
MSSKDGGHQPAVKQLGIEAVKNQVTVIRAREASLIVSGFWLGVCDSHRFFPNFQSPFFYRSSLP